MKKPITLGVAAAAGLLGLGLLAKGRRERFTHAIGHRLRGRMERMMASLPENSPPRLVMSVLPQLREQNNQIIGLLREQNALLAAKDVRTNVAEPES
ncbi:hypothetical protein ACPWT1_20450 [Ramlibacter sp. MMS24-I3-19]|uniref:hypothetical protein n=1 Tax=Ramlibacter sp. MMS24-I3-19 TaxID=3416606 RepID=UPI003CFF20D7